MKISEQISKLHAEINTHEGSLDDIESELLDRLKVIETNAKIEEHRWDELEGTINFKIGQLKLSLEHILAANPETKYLTVKDFAEITRLQNQIFEAEKIRETVDHVRHTTT